jgi:hypothetical protein
MWHDVSRFDKARALVRARQQRELRRRAAGFLSVCLGFLWQVDAKVDRYTGANESGDICSGGLGVHQRTKRGRTAHK